MGKRLTAGDEGDSRESKLLATASGPHRRRESKLAEMFRLQSPPAGYMMDAASVVKRVRREGAKNRRKREKARGMVYSDGKG
jgi:hypothetical protein